MKPVILTFIRYYLPGHLGGGAIRTVANMVDRLSDLFEFRIVTLDRDLGSDRPYNGVEANRWIAHGNAMVRYVSPDRFGMREVSRIVRSTPHDVIYLNSFFDPRFSQQVLFNRRFRRKKGCPVVIAPRGEFSEGALCIKSRRKKLFIRLVKILGLYDNVTWQASSALEAADIDLAFGCRVPGFPFSRIAIAPDLATSAPSEASALDLNRFRKHDEPFRVCTLSRISPIKNLEFSLRALAYVRAQVCFSIFGPIEDAEYWLQCQDLIRTLPSNVQVVHEGPLEPGLVITELSRCSLFVFPTRGENFGHVIHEALRAGLPVLISDQTPWRQLAESGVGWDLPLDDPIEFARRIDEAAGWSDEQYAAYAARARAMAHRITNDPVTLEANTRLFLDVIDSEGRDMPSKTVKGVGSV